MILSMPFEMDGKRERRYALVESDRLEATASLMNAGDKVVTLYQLCVRSESRGTGLGSSLVLAIEAEAKHEGASMLSAIVSENGPLGFWFSLGYKLVHREYQSLVVSKELL